MRRTAITVAACATAYAVGSLLGYQAGWHRLQGPPVLDRWRPITRPPARMPSVPETVDPLTARERGVVLTPRGRRLGRWATRP